MTKFTSKDIRVYLGPYEVGTALLRVSVTQAVEALAPTALGDAAERALPGLRADKLETDMLFDDSASADTAATALIGSSTNNVVSVYFGTGTGNVAYCGTGYVMGHQPESPDVKGLVKLIVPFTPDQTWKRGTHFGPRWAAASGSLTGSIDNGAISTGGSTWFIHAFSPSGTGTIVAQDSADGTSFAAVGSLAITTATSGLITTTGTVQRYTRLTLAAAGGSLATVSAAVIRT